MRHMARIMSIAYVRSVAREAPSGAKVFLAVHLHHDGGNPKGGPKRADEGATHDPRGEQSFKTKALVYLRGIEKGRERDMEERRKGSRDMQGEEAMAMLASDSEGWTYCD